MLDLLGFFGGMILFVVLMKVFFWVIEWDGDVGALFKRGK